MFYMFVIALFFSYVFALLISLAFELPVMNLDKIIFGGAGGSKRKPRQTSAEPNNVEGSNGTKKKSIELGEFKNPNDIEENGVKMTEQQEPLMQEKQVESA